MQSCNNFIDERAGESLGSDSGLRQAFTSLLLILFIKVGLWVVSLVGSSWSHLLYFMCWALRLHVQTSVLYDG